MSARSVARQYANALFSVAHQAGRWKEIDNELRAFVELVDGHAELQQVFESPAVPRDRRKALVAALAERGALSPELRRLLDLLAERGRLGILHDIADLYHERVMDAEGVVTAELVTAFPLDDERQRALADALGRATGRRVQVTSRVDPSVIGGVIAKVGSVVYDASVTHQLERMRQRLAAEQ